MCVCGGGSDGQMGKEGERAGRGHDAYNLHLGQQNVGPVEEQLLCCLMLLCHVASQQQEAQHGPSVGRHM